MQCHIFPLWFDRGESAIKIHIISRLTFTFRWIRQSCSCYWGAT